MMTLKMAIIIALMVYIDMQSPLALWSEITCALDNDLWLIFNNFVITYNLLILWDRSYLILFTNLLLTLANISGKKGGGGEGGWCTLSNFRAYSIAGQKMLAWQLDMLIPITCSEYQMTCWVQHTTLSLQRRSYAYIILIIAHSEQELTLYNIIINSRSRRYVMTNTWMKTYMHYA